jgi:SAM-dependent methyltransferase
VAAGPDWLGTGTGIGLLQEEARQVGLALDSIFGDQLVQVGCWGDPGLFRQFARTRRSALVAAAPAPGVDLVSDLHDLALGSDTVDAVLLPHVLERSPDPHGILREADRVLRSDGHLVILGFNPLGWWGLRHYLSRRRFPRGMERMIPESRLRDWLTLLNFSVQRCSFYHFSPPWLRQQPPAGRFPTPVDVASGSLGRLLAPPGLLRRPARWRGFASCYLVVARKEVMAVTPLRQAYRPRPRLVGGLVNPTTRMAA